MRTNAFIAIYKKILKFQFIVDANVKKDLFTIKQMKIVFLLAMLTIV